MHVRNRRRQAARLYERAISTNCKPPHPLFSLAHGTHPKLRMSTSNRTLIQAACPRHTLCPALYDALRMFLSMDCFNSFPPTARVQYAFFTWVRRLQLTSAFGGEVRPSLNSRPFSDVPRCNRLEVGQSISTILDDGVASASLPDPVSQVHMLARCYPRHNRGAIFSRPFCLRVTESRLFRLVLGMAVQITSSLQLFHAFRPFGIIHEHPQVQRQASGAPRAFLLPSGTVLHSSHSVL